MDGKQKLPSAAKVAIIGGSLAGLMFGLSLSRMGCEVCILEEKLSGPSSYGSGIRVGPNLRQFMRLHGLDNPEYTIAYGASRLRLVSGHRLWWTLFPRIDTEYTRWETVYRRVLAAFIEEELDQRSSDKAKKKAGKTSYRTGKQVVNLQQNDPESSVAVEFIDSTSGKLESLEADLVIAAHGASSGVTELLPACPKPVNYAGYVAWRGTVPVCKLSRDTLAFFENYNNLVWGSGESFNLYRIPSPTGSLEPSEQLINFVWYFAAPKGSSKLKEIMTDKDGRFHRSMVPKGIVSPAVWERQKAPYIARSDPISEVMRNIEEPFAQVINEYCRPHACFFNDKLLLVGDALCLSRPHLGLSTDIAATEALLLEKVLQGSTSLQEWERQVLQQAHMRWKASQMLGNLYHFGVFSGLLSGVKYLWMSLSYSLRARFSS